MANYLETDSPVDDDPPAAATPHPFTRSEVLSLINAHIADRRDTDPGAVAVRSELRCLLHEVKLLA